MQARQELSSTAKDISDLNIALDEHAIVAITDPHGKITSVNDRFCAISGYSRDELIGQDHRLLNSGYHSKDFFRELWTTIARGKVWKNEIKNKARDGAFYWVDATILPVLNGDGKPRKYVSLCVEAAARKAAEAKNPRANAELEERVAKLTAELQFANRELEAFLYSVSHDLRAPLRAITGFSRILEKDLALSAEAQRTFDRIRGNVTKMGRLIDGLMDYSSLNWVPVVKKKIAPAPIAQEVFRELHSNDGKRRVVFEINELPECNADAALLKQAFTHLLSNSLKFTHGRDPAMIKVGCRDEKKSAVYFVQDNGVGFDMAYSAKLFRIFQRLHSDDQFDGAGVGLAIVQRILQRHGGRVWAEAQVDRGAIFYFTLSD